MIRSRYERKLQLLIAIFLMAGLPVGAGADGTMVAIARLDGAKLERLPPRWLEPQVNGKTRNLRNNSLIDLNLPGDSVVIILSKDGRYLTRSIQLDDSADIVQKCKNQRRTLHVVSSEIVFKISSLKTLVDELGRPFCSDIDKALVWLTRANELADEENFLANVVLARTETIDDIKSKIQFNYLVALYKSCTVLGYASECDLAMTLAAAFRHRFAADPMLHVRISVNQGEPLKILNGIETYRLDAFKRYVLAEYSALNLQFNRLITGTNAEMLVNLASDYSEFYGWCGQSGACLASVDLVQVRGEWANVLIRIGDLKRQAADRSSACRAYGEANSVISDIPANKLTVPGLRSAVQALRVRSGLCA